MTSSKGSPVVVGGATSAEQVVQNAAAGSITLSAADRAEIEPIDAAAKLQQGIWKIAAVAVLGVFCPNWTRPW
jgi:aryl-alcohol dehydrogenase-like predicted oxidoreductase